jgi:CMP-N-acetylneuraminic acid synthetase
MSFYYVIPCRKNSKGFKYKNRFLFEKTANKLNEIKENVIITSDDNHIEKLNIKYGFKFLKRSNDLSLDTTDMRSVLIDVVDKFALKPEDHIVLLYLTYPERTIEDIRKIIDFYKSNNGSSLLCKEELIQHPYLCFYDKKDNKGERIIKHDLYRRQDYPSCFFGSHFLSIVKVFYLKNVDRNLFGKDTIFYDLEDHKLDVDYELDYLKLN